MGHREKAILSQSHPEQQFCVWGALPMDRDTFCGLFIFCTDQGTSSYLGE